MCLKHTPIIDLSCYKKKKYRIREEKRRKEIWKKVDVFIIYPMFSCVPFGIVFSFSLQSSDSFLQCPLSSVAPQQQTAFVTETNKRPTVQNLIMNSFSDPFGPPTTTEIIFGWYTEARDEQHYQALLFFDSLPSLL